MLVRFTSIEGLEDYRRCDVVVEDEVNDDITGSVFDFFLLSGLLPFIICKKRRLPAVLSIKFLNLDMIASLSVSLAYTVGSICRGFDTLQKQL